MNTGTLVEWTSRESIFLVLKYKSTNCYNHLYVGLCYDHKSSTDTVRVYFTKQRTIRRCPCGARPVAGRIVRFLSILDIIRCPVKFRYYFKFHGAQSAFAHIRRTLDDFCLKWKLYDLNKTNCKTIFMKWPFSDVKITGNSARVRSVDKG